MNVFNQFYESLGVIGIPLLLVALWAIFICVKVYCKLWLLNLQFKKFFRKVESGNTELLSSPDERRNPLVRVVQDIVSKSSSGDLRSEIDFLFNKHFYPTKRSFTTLHLIAVCAPLLGLLGTVIGIIQVFAAIADAGNAGADNQALARGIGQALYTTVFGIVIALPTLVALNYLRQKLLGCAIMVTEYAERALAITGKTTNEKQ